MQEENISENQIWDEKRSQMYPPKERRHSTFDVQSNFDNEKISKITPTNSFRLGQILFLKFLLSGMRRSIWYSEFPHSDLQAK